MNNIIVKIATLLKVFLGAFFVFSAITKFVDLDRLNVYIYSFGIVSFNLSIIASWLLIVIEMVLGMMLLSNRWHRVACISNVLLLMAFSLFLGYAILSGRTDSCHCLGEMIPFDPVESLLKNAVLLVVLLFVWKYASESVRIRWWVPLLVVVGLAFLVFYSGRMGWLQMTYLDLQYCHTLLLCVLVPSVLLTFGFYDRWWCKGLMVLSPLVAAFVLSVAANWIHTDTDAMVDQARFSSAIAEDGALAEAHVGEGRKVVSIFSRTCSYCRLASKKISMIQQRNDLDSSLFISIFPGDDTVGISAFYEEGTRRFSEYLLPDTTCFIITRAQVPLVMLVEDGKVVSAFSHSDVSESAIVDFLQK